MYADILQGQESTDQQAQKSNNMFCNRGRVAPRAERSHASPFGVKVDGDRL